MMLMISFFGEMLAEALDVLNDREKDILTQRRLSDETVTLEDLSAQYGVKSLQAHVKPDPEGLSRLAALVGDGTVKPQVGRILDHAEAGQAHRISETGHVRGKIVLRVR